MYITTQLKAVFGLLLLKSASAEGRLATTANDLSTEACISRNTAESSLLKLRELGFIDIKNNTGVDKEVIFSISLKRSARYLRLLDSILEAFIADRMLGFTNGDSETNFSVTKHPKVQERKKERKKESTKERKKERNKEYICASPYTDNYGVVGRISRGTLSDSTAHAVSSEKGTELFTDEELTESRYEEEPMLSEALTNTRKLTSPVEDSRETTYRLAFDLLNNLASTNFRFTRGHKKLIFGLIIDGYTQDDILSVIKYKVGEWKGTTYEPYLRPHTLFGDKFGGYLYEATSKKKQHKDSGTKNISL